MIDQFAEYSHAIAALAIWALMSIILGGLSTVGRTAETRSDCGKPIRDYANPVYRRERAFANAVEVSGPFIAATLAAILAGAAPFVVNLLASIFIAARIVMAVVHIGTENQPMRSAMFVIGWLCMIGLAISAIWAVF